MLSQYERVFTEKLMDHLKLTPYSHKLGVLYVVDSIVRGYQEGAAADGQTVISPDSPEGTYAAGVFRISQLIVDIFVNIFAVPPLEDVKVSLFIGFLLLFALLTFQ